MLLYTKNEMIQFNLHHNIEISLFCFATAKLISALLLMPNKDHKY